MNYLQSLGQYFTLIRLTYLLDACITIHPGCELACYFGIFLLPKWQQDRRQKTLNNCKSINGAALKLLFVNYLMVESSLPLCLLLFFYLLRQGCREVLSDNGVALTVTLQVVGYYKNNKQQLQLRHCVDGFKVHTFLRLQAIGESAIFANQPLLAN